MTVIRPRGSQTTKTRVAKWSAIRDRDKPVTAADLKALRKALREARKAREEGTKKGRTHGVGMHAKRTQAELAARPQRPLTERQQDLLDLLTDEPERPKLLGEVMELNASQMGSVMSSLCARGLAMKTPEGWRRA